MAAGATTNPPPINNNSPSNKDAASPLPVFVALASCRTHALSRCPLLARSKSQSPVVAPEICSSAATTPPTPIGGPLTTSTITAVSHAVAAGATTNPPPVNNNSPSSNDVASPLPVLLSLAALTSSEEGISGYSACDASITASQNISSRSCIVRPSIGNSPSSIASHSACSRASLTHASAVVWPALPEILAVAVSSDPRSTPPCSAPASASSPRFTELDKLSPVVSTSALWPVLVSSPGFWGLAAISPASSAFPDPRSVPPCSTTASACSAHFPEPTILPPVVPASALLPVVVLSPEFWGPSLATTLRGLRPARARPCSIPHLSNAHPVLTGAPSCSARAPTRHARARTVLFSGAHPGVR